MYKNKKSSPISFSSTDREQVVKFSADREKAIDVASAIEFSVNHLRKQYPNFDIPDSSAWELWWGTKNTENIKNAGLVIGRTIKVENWQEEIRLSWRLDFDPQKGIHINFGCSQKSAFFAVQLKDQSLFSGDKHQSDWVINMHHTWANAHYHAPNSPHRAHPLYRHLVPSSQENPSTAQLNNRSLLSTSAPAIASPHIKLPARRNNSESSINLLSHLRDRKQTKQSMLSVSNAENKLVSQIEASIAVEEKPVVLDEAIVSVVQEDAKEIIVSAVPEEKTPANIENIAPNLESIPLVSQNSPLRENSTSKANITVSPTGKRKDNVSIETISATFFSKNSLLRRSSDNLITNSAPAAFSKIKRSLSLSNLNEAKDNQTPSFR